MLFRVRAATTLGLAALLPATACGQKTEAAPAAVVDAGSDAPLAPPDAGVSSQLAARHFGAFADWATPIEDFLAVARKVQGAAAFNAGITELMPFGDRLFFGYGDGNVNLGEHAAIEMRFFSSPDDPAAHAMRIDGAGQGADQTTPEQSGEEQIDRYRILDGDLWQAGVDSTNADEAWTQARTMPKSIQGNAYRLEGDTFKKFRSIRGGEHVHDLASFQGAIYGVGSGADLRTEFEAGQVFRYLWRSRDRGVTFETITRVECSQQANADTRWVHLLATQSALYLFGYDSTFTPAKTSPRNATFEGQTATDLPAEDLRAKLFALGTQALPDGSGLVWGIDVSAAPAHYTAGHVDASGAYAPLASLADATVLDVSLTDTGEILMIVTAGNAYVESPKHWDVRVLVAPIATPDETTELLQFGTNVAPTSIAHYRGSLFLGTAKGKVLRAVVTE